MGKTPMQSPESRTGSGVLPGRLAWALAAGIFCVLVVLNPKFGPAQTAGEVIFSEVMWMGSFASYADEWIELRNMTDRPIDLAYWSISRLVDGEEEPMLAIEQGVMPPGGLFLIANFAPQDERSHLAVTSDLVTTAVSLANQRLQLKLYGPPWSSFAGPIDVADDGVGAPAAGDNTTKCSMVRKLPVQDGALPSSWYTATTRSGWEPGTTELGTPGADNERGDAPVQIESWGQIKAVR
jgi:hypothetical protein